MRTITLRAIERARDANKKEMAVIFALPLVGFAAFAACLAVKAYYRYVRRS